MVSHSKWVTEQSAMGIRDFADWYRFGEGGAAPLVHYTGGSISWQAHQERFHSQPTPILEEFVRAWERTGRPRVDLVISPAPPPGALPRPEPLESFLEYVMDELLVRLPSAPSAHAFLGYSLGGSFATYLAGSTETCRALAVFGGAGVVNAAKDVGPVQASDLATVLYRNVEDPLQDPTMVAPQLAVGFHARAMAQRPGAHPYVDYAANRTVEDAFVFALERLR